mmetsp:Transcript_19740/g.66623  ORF Transcript_19740/g.66623 Transcript_19740/m.66623 type:complete len:341 (-) Transcript_19740:654-1676(-)
MGSGTVGVRGWVPTTPTATRVHAGRARVARSPSSRSILCSTPLPRTRHDMQKLRARSAPPRRSSTAPPTSPYEPYRSATRTQKASLEVARSRAGAGSGRFHALNWFVRWCSSISRSSGASEPAPPASFAPPAPPSPSALSASPADSASSTRISSPREAWYSANDPLCSRNARLWPCARMDETRSSAAPSAAPPATSSRQTCSSWESASSPSCGKHQQVIEGQAAETAATSIGLSSTKRHASGPHCSSAQIRATASPLSSTGAMQCALTSHRRSSGADGSGGTASARARACHTSSGSLRDAMARRTPRACSCLSRRCSARWCASHTTPRGPTSPRACDHSV